MGQELAIPEDRSSDGKALAQLSGQHRRFVLAMVEEDLAKGAAMRAAEAAGYHPLHGYILMRNDGVLAAIREESTKKLQGSVLVATKALVDIAEDESHRDRFKASKEILSINGYTPEQKIVVEHRSSDTKQQIEQIRALAKELGIEPQQLLAGAGIMEGEFSDVEEELTPSPNNINHLEPDKPAEELGDG